MFNSSPTLNKQSYGPTPPTIPCSLYTLISGFDIKVTSTPQSVTSHSLQNNDILTVLCHNQHNLHPTGSTFCRTGLLVAKLADTIHSIDILTQTRILMPTSYKWQQHVVEMRLLHYRICGGRNKLMPIGTSFVQRQCIDCLLKGDSSRCESDVEE
ncbi:hypothetical protein NPIL_39951 [Nephila pilipes]|uniref:Uncharacterized protein n=1 Tax=Nephila pilipes TaxID=299642 RepID=A0A8X6TYV3_NEPPI|nr:hypothetical protein NPIL_39951 [Nephila pilipes]